MPNKMGRFTFFVLMFVTIGAVTCASINTTTDDGDDRILHGVKAKQNEFPYMVSIQDFQDNAYVSKFCGGVIIDKLWILTAAHCVKKPHYSSLRINAGIVDAYEVQGSSNQWIEVAKIIRHNNYDKSEKHDDIALLKLKTPLKFTKSVQLIALPPKGYKATGSGDIIGWGTTNKEETKASDFLLKATLPVSDPEECEVFFESFGSNQLCLGHNTIHNACSGDSGGPFIQKNSVGKDMVVGVTSYGTSGCYEKVPIVYTEVSAYLDWIQSTLKTK